VSDTLVVNEIYLSLQGESTFAGLPCIFVRLTACNLRCSYCDTAYAFKEGEKMSLPDVLQRVRDFAAPFKDRPGSLRLPLVELTGGEPLLQATSLPLMTQLCDEGLTVLIETSGAHDISKIDPRVRVIMDLKCPSSGESARNRWENIPRLKPIDEVKFVIGTIEDYQWSQRVLSEHDLPTRCPILFSWVAPLTETQRDNSLKPVPHGQTPITRKDLAERIIQDKLPVRFQVQMHKVIWSPDERGV